jgi:DNA-binding response OmpR family regulator
VADSTVLVVEEDPGIRTLLVELLTDAGYAVLEASRGAGGLHLAAQCAPSLVMVNHVLPDMSGLDMLDQLRQRRATRGIPTILVSGRAQQLVDGVATADRVVPLPFDIDGLLMHVEQLTASGRGTAATGGSVALVG